MNRAERRRLEKLARTKPAERLETLPGYMAPVAMSDCFGFRARRIARVWHKADEIYAQMLRQLDDGIPLDTVEELFNKRLMDETGLAFGLTNSAESLREQEGVSA